ncbi:MAG TPA: SGNH/GDSL hydrolase family protein [Polyangiaceae bacterium]|nr:SGNH/GDSL hydrolase family protein [Polyangiaceae bacterium]
MNSGPDEPVAPRQPPSIEPAAHPIERPAPQVQSEPVPRAAAMPPQESLPRYPFQRVHSPLTSSVGQQIRHFGERHPQRKADRFSKVGDSITRSAKFLTCLAETDPAQLDPALQQTLKGLHASPFDSLRRESSCAENGWSAWQPLAGRQPPLVRELGEVQGLFAFVLLGTNDIETSRVTTFARRFVKLIDATLAQGAIPLVSTIPERRDRQLSRLKVPRFNAAIRAIAQARRVPLVDLHYALSQLPNEGLANDGIHPSVLSFAGQVRACDFGPAGLRHGFNVRNWLALQSLARVQSVLSGEWEPDVEAAPATSEIEGRLQIAELPFVEVRSLTAPRAELPGCTTPAAPGARDGSLAFRYEVALAHPAFLEVLALSSATAESLAIEVTPVQEPARCLAVGKGFTRTALGRGNYSVTVSGKATAAMVGVLLGRNAAS